MFTERNRPRNQGTNDQGSLKASAESFDDTFNLLAEVYRAGFIERHRLTPEQRKAVFSALHEEGQKQKATTLPSKNERTDL